MTSENAKKNYEHLLKVGRVEDAEAIDKVYNFSKKQKKEKNVLEKIAEEKEQKD